MRLRSEDEIGGAPDAGVANVPSVRSDEGSPRKRSTLTTGSPRMESVLVRNLWLLFTTKEKTKRAIEEEAAMFEVALKTRVDERDTTLRGQRLEEQLKFREGLYRLLKAKGI